MSSVRHGGWACVAFSAAIFHLFLGNFAQSATITAASTASSDVQTAINSAANGDTVLVPAGSATWSSTVTVNKGIRLIGAGEGQTLITQGGATKILVVSGNGQYLQVSGFSFYDSGNANYSGFMQMSGNAWRFCSNSINCSYPAVAIYNTDTSSGLVDNNDCYGSGSANFVTLYGTANAWNYGTTYGTTNYCYVEHNRITFTAIGDGAIDAYGGAKFVFRYNTLTNAMVGWHGADSGGYRAPHSFEIYGNKFYWSNGGYYAGIQSRGGTGLVFSNAFIGSFSGTPILLQCFRYGGANSTCATQLGNCSPWGSMTGSNPYDGNQTSDGWPGLDQAGRTGPTVFNSGSSTQVSSPMYIWNNTPTSVIAYGQQGNIQSGRDFFNNTVAPNYTPLVDPHPLAGGVAAPAGSLSLSASTLNYGPLLTGGTSNQTITIQNTGTTNVSGSATVAAPFSIVSGGSYNLAPNATQVVTIRYAPTAAGVNSGTVSFSGGGNPSASVTGYGVAVQAGWSVASASGTIVSPLTAASGSTIIQTTDTTAANGGRAFYGFNVSSNGSYMLYMAAGGTNAAYNSVYVNFDSIPTDPTMIYDMPVMPGVVTNVVSWRGTGADGTPQYPTNVWNLTAGNHVLWVVGRDANVQVGQISLSDLASASRPAPPSITSQPQSISVPVGQTASFTVGCSGTAPISYQWYKGSSPISGATAATYSKSNVQTNDAGSYYVVVSNSQGSAQSSGATLTVTAAASGSVYYVAPNGNDSNNGSINSPWATIRGATGKMKSGDTLYVRGGNYSEIWDIYGPNGTQGAPTVVMAYPGETPIFIGPGISNNANSLNSLNWFVLDGLTINSYQQALFVWSGCSNVTVRNLTVYNTGQEGIHVRDYSYNITIEKCTIHDTGKGGVNGEGLYLGTSDFSGANDGTHNLIIRSNTLYNTLSEGIELKPGTHDITIDHNILYSCNKAGVTTGAGGGSIEVDEEGTYNKYNGNPNHIIVGNIVWDTPIGIRAGNGGWYYNNVVYGASQYGLLINNNDADPYTRYVYNNTIDMPTSSALVNNGGTTDIKNNIGPNTANNMATSAAYYVNAANHDYHLVSGSAPVDKGVTVSGVTVDFDGNPRPSGSAFDIGAFEFQGAQVKPAAPTGLHIVGTGP
jgi:hypothetical protein